MFDLLAPPQFIYEDFEIEQHQMHEPNLVWCETIQKWVQINEELFNKLTTLVAARQNVQEYRNYHHDPLSLVSLMFYKSLLKGMADAKKELRDDANKFCIAYRGYSLN